MTRYIHSHTVHTGHMTRSLPQYSKHWLNSDLHCPGDPGGALAELEETLPRGHGLTPFTGRPAAVDHHGLALEQAHQVGGLLALGHSHLKDKHGRHGDGFKHISK